MGARRDAIVFTILAVEAAAIGWLLLDRGSRHDHGLEERIAALESGVENAGQAARNVERGAERDRRHAAELERRVLDVERRQAEGPRADDAGGEEPGAASAGQQGDAAREEVERARRLVIAEQQKLAQDLAASTEALAGRLGEIAIKVKTTKLQQLPENERWEKAREVVGLNDVQIADIQSATVQRDGEFERCVTHRTEIQPDGATRYIGEVDVEMRQEADRVYSERLANTLNDEQRRTWHAEGFEGAFGVPRPRPYDKVDRRGGK